METNSPAALESHLGYWLRFVSNHVSGEFARKLAGAGVTVAEWVALRDLYDRDDTPSALAKKLGMTRGAVTKLADRLIARKLMARGADGADGRAQRLRLTSAGRALVPKLAALADRNDAEFFAFLGKSDRALLARILREIARRRGLKNVPVD